MEAWEVEEISKALAVLVAEAGNYNRKPRPSRQRMIEKLIYQLICQ